MSKDWDGDTHSVFVTLGASSHSKEEREKDDYYATEPKATQLLVEKEIFTEWVLEPACGEGHMSKPLIEAGYKVFSFDKIDRGYGIVKDFFDYPSWEGDVVTNPPYKYAKEFVEHALKIIPNGRKVAMLLKLQFLEGKERRKLFDVAPPCTVYVSSGRLQCAKNGEFKNQGSAQAYAWFIWRKGYTGDTIIKWIN